MASISSSLGRIGLVALAPVLLVPLVARAELAELPWGTWHVLIHYRDTFETLRRRRDGNGLTLFRQFAENYMDSHLQPILDADWQSDHPELLGMDANIRLVQAECYMLMSKPGKMQKVLNGIEDRYKGRETMLVDYPVGELERQEKEREKLRGFITGSEKKLANENFVSRAPTHALHPEMLDVQ